jgi:tetratricopeptide (TPR) repeat protein
VVQLSPRIQDPSIQKSIKRQIKHRRAWRIIWLIVFVMLIGAGGYSYYRFAQYGRARAEQLVQEGQAAQKELRFGDALEAYQLALSLQSVAEPTAAIAALQSAHIYSSRGQHEQAQELLQRAVALDPATPAYGFELVRSYLVTRDLDLADEALTQVEQATGKEGGDVENAELVTLKARLAAARGDREAAQKFAEQAHKVDSEFNEAALLLGMLTIHEDPGEARKLFEAALSGNNHQDQVSLLQRLVEVSRQLEEDSNSPAYQAALVAAALLEFGEYDVALLEAQDSIDQDNSYRDAWVFRARAELETKKLSEAKSSIQTALEIDPTFGLSHYVAAQIAAAQGDHAAASGELQKAVAVDYDSPAVFTLLADQLVAQDQVDQALEQLQRGSKLNPNSRELLEYQYWLYYLNLDDKKEAKATAKNFFEESPQDPVALGLVALSEWQTGNSEKASEQADQVTRQAPQEAIGFLVKGLATENAAFLKHAVDLDKKGFISQIARQALED